VIEGTGRPDAIVVSACLLGVPCNYMGQASPSAAAPAREVGASEAVLKARSPSCGCHEVYAGTFTGQRVSGEGVTAAALRGAGIRVRSEEDVAAGREDEALGSAEAD
jgi:uncharacterized protein YbbK (DUF523 family)